MDGWSNLVNNPVLAVCLDNQLVYTVDTTGKPHTGEYLRSVMLEAFAKVQNETKAIISGVILATIFCPWFSIPGVVTDNASNMTNMRANLEVEGQLVFTYG